MKPKWPQEPKSIIDEELKQCFARYKASWEPVERKTEVVAEKAWQSSRSSNTKSQHLEQDLESLVDLVKEKRLGQRQGRNDKSLWAAGKQASDVAL